MLSKWKDLSRETRGLWSPYVRRWDVAHGGVYCPAVYKTPIYRCATDLPFCLGGGMEELCTFAGVGVYSKPLEKAGEECLEDVAILLLASFDCMFSPPSS